MLLIGVASNVFGHNAKPNMHGKYDLGGAVANLTFEATSKGIYLHQMAGFDAEKTRTTYAIPATADPIAAIALGYLGDPRAAAAGSEGNGREAKATQDDRRICFLAVGLVGLRSR